MSFIVGSREPYQVREASLQICLLARAINDYLYPHEQKIVVDLTEILEAIIKSNVNLICE